MATITERLADLASGAFLRPSEVTAVTRLSEHFVRIELQAEPFRSATWIPGSKVQFRPQKGTFSTRTYTPIRWDHDLGTTELIAFIHGDGPGANWFRTVAVGDLFEVFGPRKSIDLSDLTNPVVFVGDESTVGLACALATVGAPEVRHVFECDARDELVAVLDELGLAGTSTVLPKTDDRAAVISAATAAAGELDTFDLVLSGDTATVAAVRRAARNWTRSPERTRVKAYWATGRTGLD